MKYLKEEAVMVTMPVCTDEEAVNKKMKLLQSKLFGLFSPVKYELKSKRKVYIPYELLIFSYEIHRGKKKIARNGMFDRSGEVGIIFDQNEVHPFHFDLFDDLNLRKANRTELKGDILEDNCTSREVGEKSKDFVQWKVLYRVFRDLGEVKMVERRKFYRPAWELEVEANKKEFIKYAYMDIYGSENEHVSGLKVRLDV